MFTIGIFSTHIPYIALVLFYSFFLFTDINNATYEDIEVGKSYTKTELFVSKVLNHQKPDTFNYYAGISSVETNRFEELIFKRQIKYPDFISAKTGNNYISYSLFSRPPPVV